MKLKLPPVVALLLEKRGAVIDKKLRATKSQLIDIWRAQGYVPHATVISFESAFGGLLLPDSPKMKKGEPVWLFGTFACLTEGGHSSPPGKAKKRVPVVNSPNDIIYYLDESGRAYAEDTIEDVSPVYYAADKTSLVSRIVFDDALFSRKDFSVDLPGLQGVELSKRFSLKLAKEASGTDRRFFTDARGEIIVVEDIKSKQTRFAGVTARHLKLVMPSTPKGAKSSPELKPFIGKPHVRIVAEQRTSLPDFFDELPDLRELEVSSNRLTALPESLLRAEQLTSLDLSFNPIDDLPAGIAGLKSLRSLSLRGCPIKTLPEALPEIKTLSNLNLSECAELDVDRALSVISRMPKLKDLTLPLSRSLTSLAPLANLSLKSLYLSGASVQHPDRLPSGLGQLKKLADLRIEYADDVAKLPDSAEDLNALRLIFSRKFTDDDIRKSVAKQMEKLYLQAFVKTL